MTKPRTGIGIGLLAAVGFIATSQMTARASETNDARVIHSHHRARTAHGGQTDPTDMAAAQADPAAQTSLHQIGYASYYGPRHHGHATASGERFDQEEMTAAHPWLPFGTRVLVTDRSTGRQVIVTINDRLGTSRRLIDLSLGAARELGMIDRGVASVELTPL